MQHDLIDEPTVWGMVAARAAAAPDLVLLVDEQGRTMTCGEYAAAAERAAAGLLADGVRPGDTVAWQMPTWIETFVLLAALARLGVRQVPMLPIYRERELTFCLTQTGASRVHVPGTWRGVDYAAMAEKVAGGLTHDVRVAVTDRALPEGDPATLPAPPAASTARDVRWIYYTSGTTADPKGAQHTDFSAIAAGRAFCVRQGVRFGDRFGIAFPFTHVGGLNNLLAGLMAGMGLVMVEAFEPRVSAGVFAANHVTIVGGAPAFYLSFIELQRTQPDRPVLPELRFMTGGGAPMPPEMHLEVKHEIGGLGIGHGWGMTESCITAINDPTDTDEHLMHTSGQAVLGMAIKAVLPDGSTAPPNVDGEMRIKGDSVMVGYLDPVVNADAWDADGWFRTGDIGHLDDNGYVRITGRMKDIIIRKGENISAKELEDLLYTHPKVLDAAVIGLPDRERGELVCAVVEVRDPADPLTFDEMVTWFVDAQTMRQKIPERLETTTLPRTATGKVLKTELRARFAGG
jgi:acyl-CoA synthetase (AMP-forming)/AMP-acid ligase II